MQVEKSVEPWPPGLATLRAGYVFLPLNTAYQSAEIEYFIGNAEPAVVVCSPGNFGWVSKIAFTLVHAACVHPGRRLHRQPVSIVPPTTATSTGSARSADDLAAILYTSGTTGRSKGAMLYARQHAQQRRHAQTTGAGRLTGGPDGKGDVLIHALPIFHVHGLFVAIHGALHQRQQDDLVPKFDPGRQ